MLIKIYDRSGDFKAEVAPADSSTQTKRIQGDNLLTLSFTHHKHITLDVYDYVDFMGERYWLCEAYRPVQKSTMEWVYDIKLYGIESLLRNFLVVKHIDNEEDPVFTLTAPPREHVAMIVRCMNNGSGSVSDWKVGQVDGTENIVIDYFGKYCDEALKEIAEKVGAEAWVEGQTVNICRCEHGDRIVLGYDKGLTGIDPDKADNVKFYTRLYPVGSSCNIDPEKYGHTRLQLPDGKKYIEVNADKYGRVDHYEDAAFADIYPRRIGEVSSVRSEVKTGEDGKPFTIYYFRDDNLTFDPNDYEIGGLVKRVSFQEGSELAGLGDEDNGTYFFEANFDSDTREFEIITIWPYDDDTQLPGGNLIPKVHDKYILWNLRMPDEYYALAENEFLTAVNKYNADHSLDISVFKCSTDHVWIEENDADLFVGRRVRLESEQLFPGTGYRDSRIIGISRKVNLPSSMDIEIGDALGRTTWQKFSDSISGARSYAMSAVSSISVPDMIRTGDSTRPTDNNLFSARRALAEGLSKKVPDKAAAKISFLDGLESGRYVPGRAGAAIDAEGNAEVGSLTARGVARVGRRLDVGEYLPGTSGASVWVDERGEAHIETATITVNKKMTVKEVKIQEQTWVGGSQINSPAGMTCAKVEEVRLGGLVVGWTCSFRAADADGREVRNEFKFGDLARCETFNLVKDAQGMTVNRYYWRKVGSLGTHTDPDGTKWHSVVLSNIAGQYDSLSTCGPAPGDRIITVGNDTDPDRQNVIITASYGDGSPYIYQYAGVDTFSLAGKLRTAISPSGNVFTGRFLMEAADGSTRDVAQSVSSLQVQADGIMGKVGMVSRNLVPQGGRWDSNTQECDMETLPGQGGFRAEEAARLSEWQSFRCEVDSSLFKPSTDYILTLYAMFQDEEEGSVVSSAEMAFRAGVLDVTHGVSLCPWASPDVKILTPGEYVPLTFRLRSASSIPAQKMYLQFIIRDWEGRTGLLRLDFREIKLEEGSVATPWVPADKDIVSVVAQQADRIDMAVKVDGKERAGLTLDAEEGITLAADKVRVKNGGLTAALFANGILNADLMQVGKLATIVGGQKRITVSEHDDGFIRFYHEDGATVAMKLGLDIVSLESQQAITPIRPQSAPAGGESAKATTDTSVVLRPTLKGKPAMAQVFDEDGKLTWVLFLDGPVTPDTQTYSWRTWSLVRETAQNSALLKTTAPVKAQEYWQFKVKSGVTSDYSPYRDRLFIKKMSDTDFTSAASYYVPDGRYFYPSAELALATVTNPVTKHIRRYYDVVSGKMTSGQMDVSEN